MIDTSIHTRIFKIRNQIKESEFAITQAKHSLKSAVREYDNMTDQTQKAAKKCHIDAMRNFIVTESVKFANNKRELDCLQKRAEYTTEAPVADLAQHAR